MNLTKKNLTFFFLALLMGSLLTLGINGLEQNLQDYFFAQELEAKGTAQLIPVEETSPKPEKFEATLTASSALSTWTDLESSKILFQKNASRSVPVASLSKLMTVFVVRELDETYRLHQPIRVSEKSVEQEGDFGLKPGEKITTKNLMAMTLIESSNDAAYALADYIGERSFVELMNRYAKKIELNETEFYNPTGLKVEGKPENHSSARDLVKLTRQILKKHPEILELSGKQDYRVKSRDGTLHHYIEENTNILLDNFPKIMGGKTGYTDQARQCLLVVMETNNGYIVNVILGSRNRFGEMRKLIESLQ